MKCADIKAREIMGRNFFGVEEVIQHFGDHAGQSGVDLTVVPWSKEQLWSCSNTHLLVAVFPMSIVDIRVLTFGRPGAPLFFSRDWYLKQPFALDQGYAGWWLVRKEPIDGSVSKSWSECQGFLGEDEETPTARILVYSMVGHFLATGDRLLENMSVRCSDLDSDGDHVNLGQFDVTGINISSWPGDGLIANLGVAAAKKH